jgi:stage II sporulation protein D
VTVRAGNDGELIVHAGQAEIRAGGTVVARPVGAGQLAIGGRPYRGTALIRYAGPGRVTAINQVDMENYLLGVVPHEIGRVGPELLEAAKAQAVAARTYAFRYLGRRESLGFDVFATVQDQVYGGLEGEHEPVSRAVRDTAGEILTYAGEPIEAFYHSTCAGQTAAIEEVWPTEQPRPYLVSVLDVNPATGEAFDVTSSRFRWTETWSADQLRQIFNRTLADSLPPGVAEVGELRDFAVLERTHSGRIARMRITTSAATFDVGRDRIRWIFLTPAGNILNSSKFDVRTVRDERGAVAEVIAEGQGWGHGIGMCQVGAMGRARAGQDYRTILRTYYPGSAITSLY